MGYGAWGHRQLDTAERACMKYTGDLSKVCLNSSWCPSAFGLRRLRPPCIGWTPLPGAEESWVLKTRGNSVLPVNVEGSLSAPLCLGTTRTKMFAYRRKPSDPPTWVASESPGRLVKAQIAGPSSEVCEAAGLRTES